MKKNAIRRIKSANRAALVTGVSNVDIGEDEEDEEGEEAEEDG